MFATEDTDTQLKNYVIFNVYCLLKMYMKIFVHFLANTHYTYFAMIR